MFVKVLQSHGVHGEHCEEGEVLEFEELDARQMIAYGRVREATKREIAEAQKKPSAPPPSGDAPAGGQGGQA